MKFRYWTTFIAAGALYAGFALPAQAESSTSNLPAGAVAVVNGVSISQSDLDAAVKAARQPDTPQTRQAIKQALITRELFRQNAEKAGYDSKPEVKQIVQATKVNAETQLWLKDNLHPEVVTDAQVKARYDEIVASLGKDEYKPRLIVVPDAMTAAAVLSELKAGKAFDVLARQYSVASSKANGGEMPWVSFNTPATEGKTNGLPLPVAQALAKLPVGGVTPEPVAVTEDNSTARVIVKLDARRPTKVPAYEQAQGTIRQQLQALSIEKASAQFVGGLVKAAKIEQ